TQPQFRPHGGPLTDEVHDRVGADCGGKDRQIGGVGPHCPASSTSRPCSVRSSIASVRRLPVTAALRRPTDCPATSPTPPPRMLTAMAKRRVSSDMNGWSKERG